MNDRYEPLDRADRWFIDIMRSVDPPGFVLFQQVDMTASREVIARLREQGSKATYTHLVTRAVALALARQPHLNRLILGRKVVHPGTVDLSLSVRTGLSMSAEPTIVVQNADRKGLVELYDEVTRRAAEVRATATEALEQNRRLTRIIPVGFVRRWLIRRMKNRMSMVRERLGAFHVTSSPGLQQAVPLIFGGIGLLAICKVEDAVVARDGQPVVRPVCQLCMVGSHRIWKAAEASQFITEVQRILESGELTTEVPALEAVPA